MDDQMYIVGFAMLCQLAYNDYQINMKKASKQEKKAWWWFMFISVLVMLFWIWMAVIYFNHVKHK